MSPEPWMAQPSRWWLVAGAIPALLVVAFLAGRYSKPAKVEEKVRVEFVEKQVVSIQEKVKVQTVVVEKTTHQVRVVEREVKRPDGTVEKTRTEDSVAVADVRRADERSSSSEATQSRERSAAGRSELAASDLPRWRLAASAGVAPLEAWKPVYGGEVGFRVPKLPLVGELPLWLSLGVRTDFTISGAIALEL